ncbi:MAG: DinB family protein [Chloroflexi bacterium]|nr:DinB family protein [Chloroflexota bacterium]
MGALSSQVGRLRTATDDLLAFAPVIAAGEPWPLSEMFGPEPEASWGPPELLAHVEEFLPYWMGEIERVLAAPAEAPASFGRIATDPLRIGVIGRDRSLPLRELVARIRSEGARVASRLDELTEAEAARVGTHPTRGELTVREMLEPFLVGHLEGHVVQLREILDAPR